MIVRVLDDRADRRLARVRAVEHRLDLALELVETVGKHLEQLQVVDRVEVHDLHHVTDDGVALGEEAGRVDHRHRVVEHAQQLVEAERDALLSVVVARAGSITKRSMSRPPKTICARVGRPAM